MASSNNILNLSKEELVLALSKANKELSLAKEEIATAKREVAEAKNEMATAKEEVAKAKNEMATAKEEAAKAKNEMAAAKEEAAKAKNEMTAAKEEAAKAKNEMAAVKEEAANRFQSFVKHVKARSDIMKESVRGVKELYAIFDKITYENAEEQLIKLFDEITQCIINAYTWRDQAYATGNDLSKSQNVITSDNKEEGKEEANNEDKKEDKNGTQQPEEKKASLKGVKGLVTSVNAAENLKKKMVTAIESSNPEDIALFSKEICHIAETNEKETEKTKKNSPGRQRVDRQPDKTLHPDKAANNVCSSCGTKMQNLADLKQKAICLAHDLEKQCENIEMHTDFHVCPKCGRVHGVFPDDADLPIQPDREISINTALYCIWLISNGCPLNRFAMELQKTKSLGHSTMQENIYAFAEIYIVPLEKYFLERQKKSKYLMLDGTPFRCLESQNLGNCMNKNPDRKRNHNQPDPVPVEEGKSNYILCCCSVPGAEEPFVTFHFLPTRSYDAIAKVITPDHCCDVIISDAFQAYNKLADNLKNILQNCLVHFRRYIVTSADLNNFAKELVKMEEQQQVAFLKERLQKGSPHILMCCIFLAISKIYSYESSYDRTQPDYLDKILEIRQKIVLPLMDDIDKVMEHFVENHTDSSKKGEGRCVHRGDPYSEAAVYWYNNHDKLRSFLEDPMIPPDTNIVEQNIRTATIIRKNSYFMTSQRGINALCSILTVLRSLYLNGVENPPAVLKDYCRALYSHCFDKAYTKEYLDNNTLGKKLPSWNMIDLSKDFDFDKFFSQILKH